MGNHIINLFPSQTKPPPLSWKRHQAFFYPCPYGNIYSLWIYNQFHCLHDPLWNSCQNCHSSLLAPCYSSGCVILSVHSSSYLEHHIIVVYLLQQLTRTPTLATMLVVCLLMFKRYSTLSVISFVSKYQKLSIFLLVIHLPQPVRKTGPTYHVAAHHILSNHSF